MNIHEYQAKQIFREFGVAVPNGVPAFSVDEAVAGAKEKPTGKALGVHPKNKQEIVLLMGRYGPYLKCGRTNYAIPKEISGHEPSLDEAIKIIDAKK